MQSGVKNILNISIWIVKFVSIVKGSNLGSLGNGLNNGFEEPIDRTFNETCCKEKGVTYECMANCKDARGPMYEGFRMGMPESRCTKFKHIIDSCIVSG